MKTRKLSVFLASLEHLPRADGQLQPEQAVRCVFALLDKHISAGEVADIRQALPEQIRQLWKEH